MEMIQVSTLWYTDDGRWSSTEISNSIKLLAKLISFLDETKRPKTFIPNDSAFWEKHFKPIISGRVSLILSQFQFEIKNGPSSGLSYVILMNKTADQTHVTQCSWIVSHTSEYVKNVFPAIRVCHLFFACGFPKLSYIYARPDAYLSMVNIFMFM